LDYKILKRYLDLLFSFFLIIFLFPLFLLIGIIIKLTSKGTIIYSQKRIGKNNKNFTCYKFRTMYPKAKYLLKEILLKNPNFKNEFAETRKIINDPRITKVGKFLRRTRLDELPQLFSVLKGDMSLIGPRPERPEIDDILVKKIPNYKLRYLVRPGLSGWAQVNYPYGASIDDTRIKFSYDIYYIKNFSTFFDLLIFLETIRLVLNLRGSQPK